MPNPNGRDTAYKEEYCQRVIDMGKEGYSIAEMASELGFAKKTLYNWKEKFPEFLHALDEATTHSQAWYEKQGRAGIWAGSNFNNATWAKQVSCRYPEDYRDVQVKQIQDARSVSDEEKEILQRLGVVIDDEDTAQQS